MPNIFTKKALVSISRNSSKQETKENDEDLQSFESVCNTFTRRGYTLPPAPVKLSVDDLKVAHKDMVTFEYSGQRHECPRTVLRLRDRKIRPPVDMHFRTTGSSDPDGVYHSKRCVYPRAGPNEEQLQWIENYLQIERANITGMAILVMERTWDPPKMILEERAPSSLKILRVWQVVFKGTKVRSTGEGLGTFFQPTAPDAATSASSLSKYHARQRKESEPMRRVMSEDWYAERKM